MSAYAVGERDCWSRYYRFYNVKMRNRWVRMKPKERKAIAWKEIPKNCHVNYYSWEIVDDHPDERKKILEIVAKYMDPETAIKMFQEFPRQCSTNYISVVHRALQAHIRSRKPTGVRVGK
jgi:hypothetical protein